MRTLLSSVFLLLFASPAHAQIDAEKGLQAAFRGCEAWVLNPASWTDGPEAFQEAVGIGDALRKIPAVAEPMLPPPQLRVSNHYFQIRAGTEVGYFLVVSDKLPMCHITGGGSTDLQPVVESVLQSAEFKQRWVAGTSDEVADMVSTKFHNRQDDGFTLVVSRANSADQRRDRPQLVATALSQPGK